MRQQAKRTILTVLATSLLAIGAAGCPDDHHNGVSAYCDDSGCYQCDADKSCWPIANPKCTSEAACGGGNACTSIGCAKGCKADSDCDAGEACVTGFCAPTGFSKVDPYVPPTACTDDAGCKADELCDAGTCIARCKSDDDCGPDSVCAPCGKCQPKGVPATCGTVQNYCSETVGCGAGKTCITGRCHLQCSASTACPVGQVCSGGTCLDDPAPAKAQCLLDLECDGGACINGYCHDACKTSSECGPGSLCQMGICQADYTPASK